MNLNDIQKLTLDERATVLALYIFCDRLRELSPANQKDVLDSMEILARTKIEDNRIAAENAILGLLLKSEKKA
jgi:hypothetical protein